VSDGILKYDTSKVSVADACLLRLCRDSAYATDSIRNKYYVWAKREGSC